LLRLEENLQQSTFKDADSKREMKNFGGVKMGSWISTDDGIEFTAEFSFLWN
jgi:hypothetical protein